MRLIVWSLVENEPHEGKRIVESAWPVFRIHHQRSRYIYDLYYKRKAISRELYDYLVKHKYADANLIAKWRKVGWICCDFYKGSFLTILSLLAAWFWEALLFAMYSAARYQLWHDVYLPCTQGKAAGRQTSGMCTLRMPRLCQWRLIKFAWFITIISSSYVFTEMDYRQRRIASTSVGSL